MENNSRSSRYQSHALVEIRKYKHLPFSIYSAVLLDLSTGGFKAEYTSEVVVKAGDKLWLSIPLGPLGIMAPNKWLCLIEVRWFDPNKFRLGGVFLDLQRSDMHILEQVILSVKSRQSKS